jgi:hypothetical protein
MKQGKKHRQLEKRREKTQQPTSGLVVLRRGGHDSFSHADEKMMERFEQTKYKPSDKDIK